MLGSLDKKIDADDGCSSLWKKRSAQGVAAAIFRRKKSAQVVDARTFQKKIRRKRWIRRHTEKLRITEGNFYRNTRVFVDLPNKSNHICHTAKCIPRSAVRQSVYQQVRRHHQCSRKRQRGKVGD
jgi:hypothetical protein